MQPRGVPAGGILPVGLCFRVSLVEGECPLMGDAPIEVHFPG